MTHFKDLRCVAEGTVANGVSVGDILVAGLASGPVRFAFPGRPEAWAGEQGSRCASLGTGGRGGREGRWYVYGRGSFPHENYGFPF